MYLHTTILLPILLYQDFREQAPSVYSDWSKWTPDPQRALWLALVIPGGGQIYNRKYWKLPLVYGGFMGCIYAMSWNNMMYKDYAQAYLDIMDDDPNTASYNKFLHLGRQITPSNQDRYKEIFRKRKDRFRRYRDLSFFVMIGVYALSVIDAYVDAELSVFDISKDLSLKLQPAVIGNSMINGSRAYIQLAPWAVLGPAVATIITVMVFNYLGDCVRDVMDVEAAS